MRQSYSTVTPAVVHDLARRALADVLDWQPFRRSVTVRDLLDLVLLVAATGTSLFAVVRRRFGFSHETARRAVRANLPDPPAVAAGFARALYRAAALSRRDRRRRWVVAIDTHLVAYYGDPAAPGVVGGRKKAGTKWFHRYATAVLLHKRRRYTVGLVAAAGGWKPHEIVAALLDQVRGHGLVVRGVAVDSEFDSGETILSLQAAGLAYVVPLRRKGSGSNRRNDCFGWPPGTVGRVAWVTERTRAAVATDVLVWRGRTHPAAKVYAFGGWGAATAGRHRRAWLARRRDRERFGIETSYRQKNQGRGATTSPSASYRVLLEGVAHLVRQLWVLLTQWVARRTGAGPAAWIGALTLAMLVDWLADALKALYPEDRCIPLTDAPLQ